MRNIAAMIKIFKPSSSSGEGVLHTFRFPDTYMDFTITSEASSEPGNSVVSIYGISVNSFQIFETTKKNKYSDKQRIEILYGFESDDPNMPEKYLEVVFSGSIERVQYLFDNGKQTMKIVCGERSKEFFSKSYSISLRGTSSVGELITAVSNRFGYRIDYEEGSEDVELMPIGRVTETGTIRNILKKNLPKGVSFYHSGDRLVIFKGLKEGIKTIDTNVGKELLTYPTVDTKANKVTITARIMPDVKTGLVLRVPSTSSSLFSREVTAGSFRSFVVEKYRIDFRSGQGTMELECSEKGVEE